MAVCNKSWATNKANLNTFQSRNLLLVGGCRSSSCSLPPSCCSPPASSTSPTSLPSSVLTVLWSSDPQKTSCPPPWSSVPLTAKFSGHFKSTYELQFRFPACVIVLHLQTGLTSKPLELFTQFKRLSVCLCWLQRRLYWSRGASGQRRRRHRLWQEFSEAPAPFRPDPFWGHVGPVLVAHEHLFACLSE